MIFIKLFIKKFTDLQLNDLHCAVFNSTFLPQNAIIQHYTIDISLCSNESVKITKIKKSLIGYDEEPTKISLITNYPKLLNLDLMQTRLNIQKREDRYKKMYKFS